MNIPFSVQTLIKKKIIHLHRLRSLQESWGQIWPFANVVLDYVKKVEIYQVGSISSLNTALISTRMQSNKYN